MASPNLDQAKGAPLPHTKPTKSFWHTEPSALLSGHRTTRDLPEHADIVIVGAGITGVSAAWHLLEPYRQTDEPKPRHAAPSILLLEAREICWGATGRNGGHCQPLLYSHPHDVEIGRFELLNHATIATLAGTEPPAPCSDPYYPSPSVPTINGKTKTFPCEFVTQPSVRTIYGKDEAERAMHNLRNLESIAPELSSHCRVVQDAAGLAELRVPDASLAIVTTPAARMWPYKFVAGVLEDLLLDAEIGGKMNVQTHTPVTSLRGEAGKWEVHSERGKVRAKHVVLATNAYTSHLLHDFAELIVPCKGQMSALKSSAELQGASRIKTSFGFDGSGRDDYLVQRPNEGGGQMMFGGGGQFGNRMGNADDSTIDDKVKAYLTGSLPEIFGLEDKRHLEIDMMWSGIMGYSRDGLPFVGAVPEKDGLWMAAGFTGHGMPNTWLSGKAVARMVARVEDGADVQKAMQAAKAETQLPTAYLLTAQRLEAARQRPTALAKDRAAFSWPDSYVV